MPRPCAQTLTSEMAACEQAALQALLSEKAWPGRHLEIGTAAGGTLCLMMEAARHQPPFVVIDPMTYFDHQRRTVEENLKAHGFDPSTVEIREGRSWDAFHAARLAREKYDFILVDGTHKFRYVMQDLHWAGLLNVGGVLALHDYFPTMRGVTLAVDHFLKRNSNYRRIGLSHSLLFLEKTAPDPRGGVSLMSGARAALVHAWLQLESSVRKRFG